MSFDERTSFPLPGECLCAPVSLAGIFVALWLLSAPGAPPPSHPMQLRGPWHEGNIT